MISTENRGQTFVVKQTGLVPLVVGAVFVGLGLITMLGPHRHPSEAFAPAITCAVIGLAYMLLTKRRTTTATSDGLLTVRTGSGDVHIQ